MRRNSSAVADIRKPCFAQPLQLQRASLYAATKASATAVVASAVEAYTFTLRPSFSVMLSTGLAAHTVPARDRDAAPARRGARSAALAGATRTTGEAVSIMAQGRRGVWRSRYRWRG